ncbi:MAG: hypothetical protein PF542_03045 [Nanoarchaeota archaeon]|jgi:hypothetical protein|nr:hypothetical protein [Nanoarchaeota archaeon]
MGERKLLVIGAVFILFCMIYSFNIIGTGNVALDNELNGSLENYTVYANLTKTVLDNSMNNSNKSSFCGKFEESSELYDDYDGFCELVEGETIYFSGMNIAIEFIGENKVILNVNGKRENSLSEEEGFSSKNSNGYEFFLIVEEILFSSKIELSSIKFDYQLLKEEYRSFCEGLYCTLYLDDTIFINEHKLKFDKFCVDDSNCDVEFVLDKEMYEVNNIKEGFSNKIANLTFNLKEIDINDGYIYFSHNYRINDSFCNDSDGGLNYSLAGYIRGFFENENYTYGSGPIVPYVMNDSCFIYDDILVEYYCGKDDFVESILYTCPFGCEEGACMEGDVDVVNLSTEVMDENETGKNVSIESVSYVEVVNNNSDIDSSSIYKKKKEKSFFGRIFSWFGF